MWRWCPLMPCETVRSRSQKTKLLPPRHCSKIPTPSTPSTSLEPTLQCENCGERQDWQDHLGRRQLKTISFQNWTKWNRNFKLKSIETNCISTYLDNFEMTSSPSSSLGRTWPCHAAVLCLVICEVHPPQVKNLTLVIFPWLDWLDQESRSHQLRVSTHRTEISKWPSCFEHFEIKVESSEEWCKMI